MNTALEVMSAKNSPYQTKIVRFGGKDHVLYSLDGITWSSRKEELTEIQERHQDERTYFGTQIKGGNEAREMREKRRAERAKEAEQRRLTAKAARAAKVKKEPEVVEAPLNLPKAAIARAAKLKKPAAKKSLGVKRKKKVTKSKKAA